MKTIKVNLKERSYNIVIGKDILPRLPHFIKKLNIGTDAYVITNTTVKKVLGDKINKILKPAGFALRFYVVADTEKSKSLQTICSIIKDLSAFAKNRRVLIIALGGGVVGDIAGFCASIYKRGIPYIQVPTTLLAQVDSAIGGKTGIDLKEGKNLVGSFYQPKLVFSDTQTLQSLKSQQISSGLAEVIKYGLIYDVELFNYLEKNCPDKLNFEYIIATCSRIKANIASQDEHEEKGLRTILNFGHTIGHAIEAAGLYKKYNHGQAIGLGMLAGCEISREVGVLKDAGAPQRIKQLLKNTGLPVKITGLKPQDIIKAHYSDKKFSGKKNKFVLLEKIGSVKIVENIPLKIIEGSIRIIC